MVVFYFLFEIFSRWSVRMDEQNKHGFLPNTVAMLAAINYYLSFAVAGLVMWHDSRTERIHRKLFLEDRKPYEDVLNGQMAALSAENERLQSKIDLTDKRHRNEVSDARNNGYKSGYVNGYAVGFEDCVSRFSIQNVPEQDLKRMARLSGIHRIKSRRSIFDEVEAVEHDGILT
jgi:hypothetical protein